MSYLNSPFLLPNTTQYQQWRQHKLEHYPTLFSQIHVKINDPFHLTSAEKKQLQTIYQQTNFVLYSTYLIDDNPNIPLDLGRTLGLKDLDLNWLGQTNGLTQISVSQENTKKHYIPYTNRPLKWHTDGYYNKLEQQIHGMILHCVRNAQQGGINGLLDHEIVYLLLRDKNPQFIEALMQTDAMTIPARFNEQGLVEREIYQGPVFSITPDGELHMRYSQRTRNITWKKDTLLTQALDEISKLLTQASPYIFHYHLKPGMGVITNNVLHDRSAFTDDSSNDRLLYRGRYINRLNQSGYRHLNQS